MTGIWRGSPHKVVGDMQICMFEMTYDKTRLAVGPKDSLAYDYGY